MKKITIIIIEPQPKEITALLSELMQSWNSIQLAANSVEALEKITATPPDLIISELDLPDVSGFELFNVLRSNQEFTPIPFVFLSNSLNESVRDVCRWQPNVYCLEKSLPIDRIVARIKSFFIDDDEENLSQQTGAFQGDLQQMNLIELIQSMDMNCKTGKLILESHYDRGEIFFQEGKIIDASTKNLIGDQAIFRMMTWDKGTFAFFNGQQAAQHRIGMKGQQLILEGLRQLDERKRFLKKLPDLQSIFRPTRPLAEIMKDPDLGSTDMRVLMQFKHNISLLVILEQNDVGDLLILQSIEKLIARSYIAPYRPHVSHSGMKLSIAPVAKDSISKIKTSQGFFGNTDKIDDDSDRKDEAPAPREREM